MRVGQNAYRGCLLGLAVGDAMGYTVDSRTLAEIREDYGPNGVLGYDLVNGYAEISSYTQIGAFTCNGLLLGITRGQMKGQMAPYVKYAALALREWAVSQRAWGRPERTFCWLLTQPEICRRHCMDTRMLENLCRDPRRYPLGTPEEPKNRYANPGSLTAAVAVGLFFDPDRMEQQEIDYLGAEAVALTHGSPLAFLTGAALAHLTSRVVRRPNVSFRLAVKETLDTMKERFGPKYSETYELCTLVSQAMQLCDNPTLTPTTVMERLKCESAAEVLAGAVYAILAGGGDFDASLIIAVNHSGRSAAVGAITGALLGARLGETALPSFYIDCLEPGEVLRELADDMYHGCPMDMGSRLFDLDWDRKYLHGGR